MFLFSSIEAQTVLNGLIMDNKNEPVEFANIVFFSMPDTVFVTGTTSLKDGSFGLTIHTPGSYLLQISFIGYKKHHQEITIREGNITLPAIILEEESQALNEITITASRPVFNIKNGILTTEVENTLLSREHSMDDVLAQIPGIINNRGTLEVFGSGQPVVYINNRKVQNMNEVSQLDVKNIRNIELITNPGARYDAGVNAVIRIYTLEKEEGIAVKVNSALRQSEKASHYENIQIDYKKQKLNTSVYYNLFGYKNKSFQYLIKDIQTDTLWQYVTDRTSYPFQKFHTFRMNVDYEFSPNHIVGMQLNEEYSNVDDNSREVNTVNANQKRYLDFFVTSDYGGTIHNSQLNAFHNARWNEHLTSELNADYVFYKNTLKQDVKEETENNELLTQMNSLSRYTIYAARYAANYHPSEKHAIIAGADVSRINGEGDMTTEPALVGYLNYKSKETKWAVFTEYNWTNTKLSLNTGLRYEVLSSMYDDLTSVEDNVKKKYHNIFPSFKISYSDKG
ncbi:TonB-dependent receptor, partial [Proteiniphilum sp. X52]